MRSVWAVAKKKRKKEVKQNDATVGNSGPSRYNPTVLVAVQTNLVDVTGLSERRVGKRDK
jgi:hypothetical protein